MEKILNDLEMLSRELKTLSEEFFQHLKNRNNGEQSTMNIVSLKELKKKPAFGNLDLILRNSKYGRRKEIRREI